MFWGQFEPTSWGMVGAWLGSLVAMMAMVFLGLGIAVHLRTLRRRRRTPAGSRHVTAAELREKEKRRDQALAHMQTALGAPLKELRDYTHSAVHEIRNEIHAVALGLEAIKVIVKDETVRANSPLAHKVDMLTERLANLQATVEARIVAVPSALLPVKDPGRPESAEAHGPLRGMGFEAGRKPQEEADA